MPYTRPIVSDFKTFFDRDFPFGGANDLDHIRDQDVTKALGEAELEINESLFYSQDEFTNGYLYLTAHLLSTNLLASSQGVNSQPSWLTNSKSVGNISESFTIPATITDNVYLAGLASTRYGLKYVMLIVTKLVGGVSSIDGATTTD
jgi:hypothetical protein